LDAEYHPPMAKASAVLLAVAACGSLPVEASHMKRLADGPLVAYDDGERLLVAPRGCADSTCMTVIGTHGMGFVGIEPFAPAGWFLVRLTESSRGDLGEGTLDFATIVQLGSPPRRGCELPLSSRGCNYDHGVCSETATQILPGGDATSLTTRSRRDVTLGGASTQITCTRYTLGANGCQTTAIACP
jgi:hypothetical protein